MEYLFTNIEYAAWLRSRKGDPYWYGTYFNPCTETKLQAKAKQYPQHYTASRMPQYRADIAAHKISSDCVGGAVKGAAWSMLGTRSPKYASEGVPDKSADGMFEYCKKAGAEWGAIKTMPDVAGVAVRYAGHVGVYVGGGTVMEWRGFKFGCVETKLSARGWTHWYRLPWVDYGGAFTDQKEQQTTLGSRLLQTGCKGADVKELQCLLVEKLGYDVGSYGCDGDFGGDTKAAVIRLQNKLQVTMDGKYGEVTHAAFMSLIAELEQADDDNEVEQIEHKTVVVTGGSVYVRAGADTTYKILTVAHKGNEFPHIATADNGWHGVEVNGKIGWITGKYTEVK